ncbi:MULTISPECIES: cytochrome C oxidase subunit IV family protein [unclassified Halomonas]|uniref:cytochrome C oxidase subunit IV family protein n=1 Tax=unclassified Halomonas TaxID=2609666 RepID=UPI002883EAC7|nr:MULTISPECIES: cytochrome C oxidase subunit IV family protein [unclassified Halomonas]MDT0500081.1 cytochrome C oxidase subunit IV family protein [Halomonas sp. PAR7]MDT0512485.1 cytochrome C oxidase subunit IV family protein [Halomonas sp. LES1]MDT0591119.1 cytochrome C oxidase subunit IV family protein [Halomonas sp. PAR8]
MTSLPGTRRLLTTWAVLMGLTVVSMVSALLDASDWQTLPLWSAALVILATGFKAQRLLMVYLNLRRATPAWKGAFVGLVILTLALIGAGYLVGRMA